MALADDHLIELTISVVLAYGSYLLADHFGFSGVIATVTAAIVLGNFGPGRTMSDAVADAIDTVWEFLAYLLTAVVFLLVGLAIPPARCSTRSGRSPGGSSAILVGRAIVVYVLLGGASRLRAPAGAGGTQSRGWLHVMFWAGLRGAVAVAMALALPADIPQRALLQEITFGVVLFTLLVQGTTIGRVVDRTIGARSDGARRGRRQPRPARADAGAGASGGGRGPAGQSASPSAERAPARRAQDAVDLVAIGPADRHPVEPLDVLEVLPGDLAQRPAGVAAEVEDAPRRPAGRRTGAPWPSAARIDSSKPPPCDDRPEVQSRDTNSGGGGSRAGPASRRPSRCESPGAADAGALAPPTRRRARPPVAARSAAAAARSRSVEHRPLRRVADELPRRIDRRHPGRSVGRRGEVRVVLARQPPVCGLDDLVLGLRVDLEDLVRVDRVRHRRGPMPMPSSDSASAAGSSGLSRRNR